MAIKIDTAAVRLTATNIENANRALSTDFSQVEAAVTNLSKKWSGDAAVTACGKLRTIKNNTYSNRENSIRNLSEFLNNIVSDNYEKNEKKLTTAASQFK